MNSFLSLFLSYLPIIPAAFMCVIPMSRHFSYSKFRTYLDMTLVVLLSTLFITWLDYTTSVSNSLLDLILIIICFTAYRIHIKIHISKALSYFLYVTAVITTSSSVALIFDAFFYPNYTENDVSVLFIVLQLTISLIMYALLHIIYKNTEVNLFEEVDEPSVWYSTLPSSVVCIAVNLGLSPLSYTDLYVNHSFRAYIIIEIALIISIFSRIISFHRIVTGIMSSERTRMRMQMLELQENQFELQQRFMEEDAADRHNHRQSMYTMQNLLQAGDYKSLREYFDSYFSSVKVNPVKRFCFNAPLNALLNYYMSAAQEASIDLKWKIDPLEKISLSDVDLCTIVGNILENAIAACRNVPEDSRFIQLSIVNEQNTSIFIVASNSYDGRSIKRDKRYVTTKRDGNGFGLTSIIQTAERNNGTAEFSDDGKIFYSNIMIPIQHIDESSPSDVI